MDTALTGALIGIAFMAGLIGSMLGMGGGILLVPILTLWLRIPVHAAIGTSLVAVVATSLAAGSVYMRSGLTNIRAGMLLETMAVVGAMAGGLLAVSMHPRALEGVVGVAALGAALTMLLGRTPGVILPDDPGALHGLDGEYPEPGSGDIIRYQVQAVPMGMTLSLAAGWVAGMVGIGGGPLKVPLMHLVMKFPIRAAIATSTFMIGVTGAAAGMVYWLQGHIDPHLAVPTVIGVFVGGQVGARMGPRVNVAVLRLLFISILVFLATRMLVQALGWGGMP